jgi:molybdopterin converting factor small subunit
MVSVKFFGSARVKFGIKELNVEASDLSSLLKITAGELKVSEKDLKQFVVYVNDVNISKLKMWKTKLKDGDGVMFLSPASGG